jgi:hypothetical protein
MVYQTYEIEKCTIKPMENKTSYQKCECSIKFTHKIQNALSNMARVEDAAKRMKTTCSFKNQCTRIRKTMLAAVGTLHMRFCEKKDHSWTNGFGSFGDSPAKSTTAGVPSPVSTCSTSRRTESSAANFDLAGPGKPGSGRDEWRMQQDKQEG